MDSGRDLEKKIEALEKENNLLRQHNLECEAELSRHQKEIKAQQERLCEIEKRFNLALNAANIGVWDTIPSIGKFYHSDQWYTMLGYDADEFPDRTDPWADLLHPADLDKAIEEFEATIIKAEPGDEKYYSQEFRMKAKDGSYRWIMSCGRVIAWKDEKPYRIIGTHIDISDFKNLQVLQQNNEARVKTILDSINTGVVIIDPKTHRISDVNSTAARMIGASTDEIVGHLCHQYVCPAQEGHCPITEGKKKVDNAERVLLNAAGEAMPVLKTVVPVDLGGKQYLLETVVDLSSRKEAEEELKHNMEELERINSLTVNREERMIALKEELNMLYARLGESEKYKIVS